MTSQEIQFEKELEIYRTEFGASIQFLYSFLILDEIASNNKKILKLINQAPLFWLSIRASLLCSTLISIGRIFDQNTCQNLDRLIGMAQKNINIFSKKSLGLRKQGTTMNAPSWLQDYLNDVYVPKHDDFRKFRTHIHKWRRIYAEKYRDIRHKIYAHLEIADKEKQNELFSKTKVKELQRMVTFMQSLYDALWQLYFNGRKPVLRSRRFSPSRIRRKPLPDWHQLTVQEHIIQDAERFFKTASKGK